MVLIFSAFALITVFLFIFSQSTHSRPVFSETVSYQALLNARSGIWKGLAMVSESSRKDTLSKIDTRDSLFGKDLFPEDSIVDTLADDGTPLRLMPYGTPDFGDCDISLLSSGGTWILSATGYFRDKQKHAHARLGSIPFPHPDTVLFIDSTIAPTGTRIEGTIAMVSSQPGKRFAIDSKKREKFIHSCDQMLDSAADSLDPGKKLVIQTQSELENMPDIIGDDCMIDGTLHDLQWKTDRTIVILGALHCLGKLHIEGARFIAKKEISIYGQSEFKSVSLFSESRIIISDQAKFSGDGLSYSGFLAYGEAEITDKSSMVVLRSASRDTSRHAITDSTFAADLAGKATFDGVLIALGGKAKIGRESAMRGILWTDAGICHEGLMQGVIKAARIDSCGVSGGTVMITGTIRKLKEIKDYRLPFFIGELSIVQWSED